MYPFNLPLFGPCLHTHTELENGLILKPEPVPSPKSQARTGFEPDIYFETRFKPESQLYRVS